jgi:uncharacterized membrane protein HdeD (DUF308 family)
LGVTGKIPIITSILIIYSLTHFRKASSTVAQRVWIMYWFSFGSVIRFLYTENNPSDTTSGREITFSYLILICALALFLAPPIGGFIVVGKMLNEYGICSLIS